eukprot:TRINITY_DN13319_c0_g3_i1.p1 TRINITY_DN13319_c0_g3~~TRINITY_DN13319_c0_g3_i1.p1  ORF type:complete len:218 (-),score=58.77 TRINITY_DN13319_c0_g3_i1:77-682(-)
MCVEGYDPSDEDIITLLSGPNSIFESEFQIDNAQYLTTSFLNTDWRSGLKTIEQIAPACKIIVLLMDPTTCFDEKDETSAINHIENLARSVREICRICSGKSILILFNNVDGFRRRLRSFEFVKMKFPQVEEDDEKNSEVIADFLQTLFEGKLTGEQSNNVLQFYSWSPSPGDAPRIMKAVSDTFLRDKMRVVSANVGIYF